MRNIVCLLLLLFSAHVHADWDDWTQETKTLFVASQLAITADWATTRNAARQDWPNGTYETNIILGHYPSTDKVDLYAIALLVSNYYITDWLPPNRRSIYLTIRTISHGAAAAHNVSLGFRLSF